VMAMEVLNGMKQALGIELYPRELYERPRLADFTAYLVDSFERAQLGPTQHRVAPSASPAPPPARGGELADAPAPSSKTPGPVSILSSARSLRLPGPVSDTAAALARSWKYELPSEPTKKGASAARSGECNQQMAEQLVTAGGFETCVCTWGPPDGPTALLVHGILEHGGAWDAVARSLAERGYRVVAPDLRGHGRSSHVAAGSAYHLIDFVADLDAVGSRLTSPITLVGHSLGAALSVAYAAARPEQVASLILIEPPTLGRDESSSPVERLRNQLDSFARPVPHPVFSSLEVALQVFRHANPQLEPELAAVMVARLTEPCEAGLRWRWDARLRTRARIGFDSGGSLTGARYVELMRSLQLPVKLVYATESQVLRRTDVDEFVRATKQSELWLKGSHNLHYDAPEIIADIVAETRTQSDHVAE
ncbi:MAG TPA: alpha/beta hydrolase, partial [Polyangiaceae bacterium]